MNRGSENLARWAALYLCRELSQIRLKVIADEFGMTHISGVSKAVGKLKLKMGEKTRIKTSLELLYQQLNP